MVFTNLNNVNKKSITPRYNVFKNLPLKLYGIKYVLSAKVTK